MTAHDGTSGGALLEHERRPMDDDRATRLAAGTDPGAPDFRRLFEAIPGLYLVLDPSLTIVAASDAYLSATMTRREEIIGREVFDVFPDNPEDPEATGTRNLRASFDLVRASRKPDAMAVQRYDIRRPEAEGGGFEERFWIPLNTPVLDGAGELIYIINRAEDVTALQQSEERFRLLVDSVKDYAILILDPKGHVTSWNQGAARIKGYLSEEIIGQHFSRFYPPEDVARGKPEMELRVAAAEGRFEDEGWRLRKDGSRFWANVVITALRDPSGGLRGFAKVTRDITERKRAETLLAERTAALEVANQELEAFSYSVSHDLRAPLRSLDGFSQVLEEDCAGRLGAGADDAIRRIRAAAGRMGHLIDDMLKLSRVSRTELRRERVDLSEMARDILAELSRREPGRTVATRVADGIVVEGDPPLLRLALENLLGNAFKFTSKRSDAFIEFGQSGNGGPPALYVRDNGAGFDMAYADKLFGAFQRLHGAGDFAGTGIGLATVQRVIHRHGGRIWAEAAVGEGATFSFSLPGGAHVG
jgi:PAS domain S-box-containing protein